MRGLQALTTAHVMSVVLGACAPSESGAEVDTGDSTGALPDDGTTDATNGGATAGFTDTSSGGLSDGTTDETGGAAEDDRLLRLPPLAPCDPLAAEHGPLRVATWNIGATLNSSVGEVVAVLDTIDADVVLVQEIEIGANRSGQIDQPAVLAAALGYQYAFAAALQFDGGDFGLAVFSRLDFAEARRIGLTARNTYEPRIALDVTVCAGPTPLRLVDVHADFLVDANLANLGEIASVLGPVDSRTMIAGDFNAEPETQGVQALIETTGTIDLFAARDPGPTRLDARIDFMLASPAVDAVVVDVTRLLTEASDHAVLAVDFEP